MGTELSLSQLKQWSISQQSENVNVYFKQNEEVNVHENNPVIGVRRVPVEQATHIASTLDETVGVDEKTARKNARKSFLSFIKRECGLPDSAKITDLPLPVREAMNCTGFKGFFRRLFVWGSDSSSPLTARRVRAVTNAISTYQSQYKSTITNCPFFAENSKVGLQFLMQWNLANESQPFGLYTTDMLIELSNLDPKNYKEIGAALNIFGTKCTPNLLYKISQNVGALKTALTNGELDAIKLFGILKGDQNAAIPASLSKAVASKNKTRIAEELITSLNCNFKDYEIGLMQKNAPERYMVSMLSSKFPVFKDVDELKDFVAKIRNGNLDEKKAVMDEIKRRFISFGGATGSSGKGVDDALHELFRNRGTNNTSIKVILENKGKRQGIDIRANETNIGLYVNSFEDEIDKFLGDMNQPSNQYLKGMLMSSLMQQGNSTLRIFAEFQYGFQPKVRVDTLQWKFAKTNDGGVSVSISTNPGRIDCMEDRKTGDKSFYNVNLYYKYTFYPDGRQKINDMRCKIDLAPNKTQESEGILPLAMQGVKFKQLQPVDKNDLDKISV